jgi:hypothetical protein
MIMYKIMKARILLIILVIVGQTVYGQRTKLKPMFKVAGVDSGIVTLTNILVNDKIQPNSPGLKVISAEIYIISSHQYIVTNKGDRLNPDVKAILSRVGKGQSCKLVIGEVRAIKENGDTIRLANPLKISVQRE